VHVAVRANRCTFLANVPILFDIAALTAERHLKSFVVRVRYAKLFFFLATGKRQQQRREH
jgi:hypothetical protein